MIGSPYHGPIPEALWDVLEYAHSCGGITLQSDFARAVSADLALAASCGWVSTIDPDGRAYNKRWRITAAGLTALQHKEDFKS